MWDSRSPRCKTSRCRWGRSRRGCRKPEKRFLIECWNLCILEDTTKRPDLGCGATEEGEYHGDGEVEEAQDDVIAGQEASAGLRLGDDETWYEQSQCLEITFNWNHSQQCLEITFIFEIVPGLFCIHHLWNCANTTGELGRGGALFSELILDVFGHKGAEAHEGEHVENAAEEIVHEQLVLQETLYLKGKKIFGLCYRIRFYACSIPLLWKNFYSSVTASQTSYHPQLHRPTNTRRIGHIDGFMELSAF